MKKTAYAGNTALPATLAAILGRSERTFILLHSDPLAPPRGAIKNILGRYQTCRPAELYFYKVVFLQTPPGSA